MMPHYRLSPSSLLRLMLCALAGVSVQSASALPADPLPRIVVQPDGSKVTVRQLGDEFHHFFITPDSLPLVEQAGYLYTISGRGNFVAPESEWRGSKVEEMVKECREKLLLAREAGVTREQLLNLVNTIFEEAGND